MTLKRNSESPDSDPLDTQELGYDNLWCKTCQMERYFRWRYVPFHLEASCTVCGHTDHF